MTHHCSVNCIVPPHVLDNMLRSDDPNIRSAALNTLLATTSLRAERHLVSRFGFVPNATGKKQRSIYDCHNGSLLDLAKLVRTEGDPSGGDPSVNAAYENLGITYDFLSAVFGRNSIDGRGMRLDAYVHYRRGYNNAFWDGRRMVFGDGDGRVFTDFTRSLDVIAHELIHGVTESVAGLQYHNQSGALNESMSDVFASLVKQWALEQTADEADWLIGADIFTPGIHGDALRSLRSPGEAYDDPVLGRDPQPDHMDEYVHLPDTEEGDWGGVHINSGIPNKAFYLVATGMGGEAWKVAGHIWYKALEASGPTTGFKDFAVHTVQAASLLYGTSSPQQRVVLESWREVGIRDISPSLAPGAIDPDSRDRYTTLLQRLDALAEQVKTISETMERLGADSTA